MMSQETSANNHRIARNTLLLYVRMLFTMSVTFYMSRMVLEVLGVEDFGIYNVVGGIVAMFSMLSGSLSSAINRFLTVELSKGNWGRLAAVFSSAMYIQVFLSVIICLLAEFAGVWLLNNKMNIPQERLSAANWVLQCSIMTFMVNLVSVPYNAAIIAHERMSAFAYISLLEAALKLGVTYLLFLSLCDGLVLYSLLLLGVSVIVRFIYGVYCRQHFPESRWQFIYDKGLLKEMWGFAGWNFIGVTSGVLRDQGVNILLNLFFGPAVNAARAISMQVGAAVNTFANNFMTALNPQIMKSYAVGDNRYMMSLVFQGARFSYYLLLLLSLPVLVETEALLALWLKSVPDHTVCFVRLMILFTLFESLSQPLVTAMFATGKIRNYQIVVGGIQMLIFPLSYIAFRYEAFPEMTMYITIIVTQACLFSRLFMLRNMIGLSIADFMSKVYLNILCVSATAVVLPAIACSLLPASPFRFLLVSVVCVASTVVSIYGMGCSGNERVWIRQKFFSFIYKK